jgi:hypothetical protein
MPVSPASDPILKRFRAALDVLYGDRIERVVLYGSRARGDAQEGGAARTRPQTLMRRRQGTPADRRDRGLRQGPVHDVPLRAGAADLL